MYSHFLVPFLIYIHFYIYMGIIFSIINFLFLYLTQVVNIRIIFISFFYRFIFIRIYFTIISLVNITIIYIAKRVVLFHVYIKFRTIFY